MLLILITFALLALSIFVLTMFGKSWEFLRGRSHSSNYSGQLRNKIITQRPIIGILSQVKMHTLTYYEIYHLDTESNIIYLQIENLCFALTFQELKGNTGVNGQQTANRAVNYGSKYKSHIPACYVKFIEAAGGRVVPIFINRESGDFASQQIIILKKYFEIQFLQNIITRCSTQQMAWFFQVGGGACSAQVSILPSQLLNLHIYAALCHILIFANILV